MHQVYLALGSNLGDRRANIERAVTLIGERMGTVARRSSLMETEPWGFESIHRFLNAVILCETRLAPRQLLQAAKEIERELGRKEAPRPALSSSAGTRYADRPIDIDILLYDNLTVDEPDLQIPHPLMRQRDFVMKPLSEILPQD